jgi:hypothetical protein
MPSFGNTLPTHPLSQNSGVHFIKKPLEWRPLCSPDSNTYVGTYHWLGSLITGLCQSWNLHLPRQLMSMNWMKQRWSYNNFSKETTMPLVLSIQLT